MCDVFMSSMYFTIWKEGETSNFFFYHLGPKVKWFYFVKAAKVSILVIQKLYTSKTCDKQVKQCDHLLIRDIILT